MRVTRSQQDTAERLVFDDGFAELRESFRTRLGSDRIHLVALSTSLAHAVGPSALILNDLRNRAHRLSGTAAIFELVEIAKAARSLELAVDSALASSAHDAGACLCAAMDALIHLIATLSQEAPCMRASVAQPRSRAGKRTLHS